MTIPAFNSCVGDDGNTICVFSCSQDLLDICDVVLKYQDKNGDTISNKVTSTQWIKTYDSKTHPLVIWMDYDIKPKEGAKENKEFHHMKAEYQIVTVGGAVHCSAQIVPEFIILQQLLEQSHQRIICSYSFVAGVKFVKCIVFLHVEEVGEHTISM